MIAIREETAELDALQDRLGRASLLSVRELPGVEDGSALIANAKSYSVELRAIDSAMKGFPRNLLKAKMPCVLRTGPEGLATQVDTFKDRLRESMSREARDTHTVHFHRQTSVYRTGDPADGVYFIETGLIKLSVLAPGGKECLLAIHAPGDVFGELCLAGEHGVRRETATAMEDTTLKAIPCREFLARLRHDALQEGFMHYLAERVTSQQEMIAHLVTVDGERRLGETLLMLGKRLGKPDPYSRRIAARISHEELSQMVGTTRPRITEFMNRLRTLGLIKVTAEHHLIVKEKKLRTHLEGISSIPAGRRSLL